MAWIMFIWAITCRPRCQLPSIFQFQHAAAAASRGAPAVSAYTSSNIVAGIKPGAVGHGAVLLCFLPRGQSLRRLQLFFQRLVVVFSDQCAFGLIRCCLRRFERIAQRKGLPFIFWPVLGRVVTGRMRRRRDT